MTRTGEELQKEVSRYLINENLDKQLNSNELMKLKTLLIEANGLGQEKFEFITQGKRVYDCYMFEINKRLKLME